jgi:hypothetical protein
MHKQGILKSLNNALKNKPTIHSLAEKAYTLQQLHVIVWLRKHARQWKGLEVNMTRPIIV